jgi:hypothetical protein
MNENLPPLPELSDLGDAGATNWGYSADDMHAYARAAIQALAPVPAVPERSLALTAALEYVGRHTPHLVYSEIAAALAAPQPAQQVAHKPLFVEMIAEHPGLQEELLQQDNWQKYATERETTAQAVIERHRGEHESLLRLLAEARRLQQEGGACARCGAWVCDPVISQQEPAQDEPVARLLTWHGPSHYPVPHGGMCARTFAEFSKESADDPKSFWKNGAPLYTRPQASKPNVGAKGPRSGPA